jgi:hypothetical protein
MNEKNDSFLKPAAAALLAPEVKERHEPSPAANQSNTFVIKP